MTWHAYDADARLRTRQVAPESESANASPECARSWFAAHEAGHAVAAVMVGVPVVEVCIRQEGDFGAFVRTGSQTRPIAWNEWAVFLAAGERAGDRWLRESGLWTPEMAWFSEASADADRVLAVESAAALPRPVTVTWGDGGEADRARMCDEADVLLARRWTAVQAVAAVLVATGHVSGTELVRMVNALEVVA